MQVDHTLEHEVNMSHRKNPIKLLDQPPKRMVRSQQNLKGLRLMDIYLHWKAILV